ncbi:MAG: hypothetical protein HSCHL_1519 [Hydrogenibacillus schlegelii]|uniref:Uncharacterized protein n=1 Tax=Hydrogenibacillus schlegelii TaxID=1484 RepID=A0A2T5GC27_HYDSH|nr:MAG: hypothetical protein HSCHL_1519 [Hydrogenibacillus schlegelii]
MRDRGGLRKGSDLRNRRGFRGTGAAFGIGALLEMDRPAAGEGSAPGVKR